MASSFEDLLKDFADAHRSGTTFDIAALYKAAGAAVRIALTDKDDRFLCAVALMGADQLEGHDDLVSVLGFLREKDYMGAVGFIAAMATTLPPKEDDDPLGNLDEGEPVSSAGPSGSADDTTRIRAPHSGSGRSRGRRAERPEGSPESSTTTGNAGSGTTAGAASGSAGDAADSTDTTTTDAPRSTKTTRGR